MAITALRLTRTARCKNWLILLLQNRISRIKRAWGRRPHQLLAGGGGDHAARSRQHRVTTKCCLCLSLEATSRTSPPRNYHDNHAASAAPRHVTRQVRAPTNDRDGSMTQLQSRHQQHDNSIYNTRPGTRTRRRLPHFSR